MKIKIAITTFIVIVVLVSSYFIKLSQPLIAKAQLEINGQSVTALPTSYCRSDMCKGLCIDTTHCSEFNYINSTLVLNGDTIVSVDASSDFDTDELLVEDMNGGLFGFTLFSKKGDVTFYIYVE